MNALKPSDLKTILHSKRANIYYLEHCRVLVNSGTVEYVTEEGKESFYWNIPIANTTTILLGTGTSITQAAMRELCKAGVLVGFTGGTGTPLYCANESSVDVEWLCPQSEYRPTEYLHGWFSIWYDAEKRLQAAKSLQKKRLEFVSKQWKSNKQYIEDGFIINAAELDRLLNSFSLEFNSASSIAHLFTIEARCTKSLYKMAAHAVKFEGFNRIKQGKGNDPANIFLDHGNYLAYGLAATATWVLGLPHGLSILHGKTRRGGLVFDAADLIKDALVMPQAFISASQGCEDQGFRAACISNFVKQEALDYMFDSLKEIATM